MFLKRLRRQIRFSTVAIVLIIASTAVAFVQLRVSAKDEVPAKADASPKVADAKQPEWKSLFDGKTLQNWKKTEFGGEGEVEVKDGVIVMQQGSELTGITWDGGKIPKMNYEISLMAQRIDGSDFFCGLTFPVNDDPCSFIVGGWGGGIVGVSSLDGLDAANNEAARYESFQSKRWYKIRLRVSEKGLSGWIDDKQMIGVETKGRKISIRHEVDLSRPLGVACFATVAGIKDIKIRELTKQEATAAITPPAPSDDTK